LSKIIHSGSRITYQPVRFADLEHVGNNGDGCFVPLHPVQKRSDTTAASQGFEGEARGSAGVFSNPGVFEKKTDIDLEAVKQEAYTRGKQDGRAAAEKECHAAVQALAEALEQVSRLRRSLFEKSKEDLIRLIMAVAQRVIRAEVAERKDVIRATVTAALESAVADDEYYIRVHPDDLESVKEHEPLFLAAMKGLQNIHFIADEDISPGGCKAESRAGDVDATIETQLEEIEAHLRRHIE